MINPVLFNAGSLTPPIPPLPPLVPWKGSFVIPDVFDPSDQFMPWPAHYGLDGLMGDGRRIWTPALRVATDRDKRRMLDEYVKRPYTHFVYNCAGWIYHDDGGHGDYGYASDDPSITRSDLLLIRSYGLAPVVCACDDANGGNVIPWKSFSENADLIPISFPMWEMNGPLGVGERQPDGTYTGRSIDVIRNTAAAAPKARLYLHFTAGHGAPGYPEERASWRYVRDAFGVKGLMSQDAGYQRNALTGDPEGTAAGLQDTAQRLGEEGLENIAFEQTTTPVYHHWQGWGEQHQKDYGSFLNFNAPKISGYCDGANK